MKGKRRFTFIEATDLCKQLPKNSARNSTISLKTSAMYDSPSSDTSISA